MGLKRFTSMVDSSGFSLFMASCLAGLEVGGASFWRCPAANALMHWTLR